MLDEFVRLRDRFADSPSDSRASADGADLDRDLPWQAGGPTAAWNLRARTRRAHGLEHLGRHARALPSSGVLWISPTGRCTRTESADRPWDGMPDGAALTDPDDLHGEAQLLRGDRPDPPDHAVVSTLGEDGRLTVDSG